MDLGARVTLVHSAPSGAGYPAPTAIAFDAPLAAPGVSDALILQNLL